MSRDKNEPKKPSRDMKKSLDFLSSWQELLGSDDVRRWESLLSELEQAPKSLAFWAAEAYGKAALAEKRQKGLSKIGFKLPSSNAPEILMSWLAARAAPGELASFRDALGRGMIHYAAWRGGVDHVQLLLSQGADLDEEDASGETPLSFACSDRNAEMTLFLAQSGARRQLLGEPLISGLTRRGAAEWIGGKEMLAGLKALEEARLLDSDLPPVSNSSSAPRI